MNKVGKAAAAAAAEEEDGSPEEERLRVSTPSGMPLSTRANIDAGISLLLAPRPLFAVDIEE